MNTVRSIASNWKKLIPDDYCLLGYLFGPMVCYVTFIICGIYFLGMDDHSDKFQSCMSTLGLSDHNLIISFRKQFDINNFFLQEKQTIKSPREN